MGSFVRFCDLDRTFIKYLVPADHRPGELPYVSVFAGITAARLESQGRVADLAFYTDQTPAILVEDGDMETKVPVAASIEQRVIAALSRLSGEQTATEFRIVSS